MFINEDVQPAVDASGASWVDRVFYVDGYDYESVKTVVDDSIEAGADLADLSGPMFALVLVLGRDLYRWRRGSIPLRDLPMEIVLDGSIYGALAMAGTVAGNLIGATLFGPAGAVIWGSAGGPAALLGSRKARHAFDRLLMADWLGDVGAATTGFQRALVEAMRQKIARNYERISQLGDRDDALRTWLRRTFEDRALAVAECMADVADLRNPRQDPVERAQESLRLMRDAGVHPASVRDTLGNLTRILTRRSKTGRRSLRPRGLSAVGSAMRRHGSLD